MHKTGTTVLRQCLTILSATHTMRPGYLSIVVLNSVTAAVTPFIDIIFSARILDELIGKDSIETVMHDIFVMIILDFAARFFGTLFDKLQYAVDNTITQTMKSTVGNKSLTLDYSVLEKKENMNLLYRATEGVNVNGGLLRYFRTLGKFIRTCVTFCYALVLLIPLFTSGNAGVGISGVLILIPGTLIAAVSSFFLADRANKRNYAFFEKNVEANRIYNYTYSMLANYRAEKDIRLYNMKAMILERFHEQEKQIFTYFGEISLKQGLTNGSIAVINCIMTFVVYTYTGILAVLGRITVGSVLRYVSVFQQFFTSIADIICTYADISIQTEYLINYNDYMNLESEMYHGTLPVEKRNDIEYCFEFRHVSFHYPNSTELILDDVSYTVAIGSRTAIVGPNGAGKTTFIKLLCRLYDPTEGSILLNGIDIKKYDYNEYITLLGVVFQDFKLFAFTVAQNVASSLSCNRERVRTCLEEAGILDRVNRMENGLDTELYQNMEQGVEISGGEAQKIAIARALYKNAPVIILDEPTSALDPKSEYEIYKRFDSLVANKTSIYISHRMSSCRFCDTIVVFDKGRIVQTGSHAELIKDVGSLYYRLWTSQAKYYCKQEETIFIV